MEDKILLLIYKTLNHRLLQKKYHFLGIAQEA